MLHFFCDAPTLSRQGVLTGWVLQADVVHNEHDRLVAYLPALRAWFTKRVRGSRMESDVDDLVQDVMMRMNARRDTGTIDNVESYLFQVAASVLADSGRRDRVRHGSAHVTMEEYHHPVEARTPERVLAGKQDIARLVQVVTDLPDRTRTVFVLHRFEGMTYAAVAAHLGISVSAVEKHMMKAIRTLAETDLG